MADPDHFKFYAVTTHAAHISRTVKLKGQFDTDFEKHSVVTLSHFGIPVSKNGEGITDKVTHLNWYEMPSTDEPVRKLKIKNQFFGDGTELDIGNSLVLLVPALKTQQKLPQGTEPPSGVSHFKCYTVVKGAIPPIRGGLVLEDQFDAENQRVMQAVLRRPKYFCVPVSKIYVKSGGVETTPTEIIEGEYDHLVIYELNSVGYKKERMVFDQFDEDPERLRTLGGFTTRYLAVPTLKFEPGRPDQS